MAKEKVVAPPVEVVPARDASVSYTDGAGRRAGWKKFFDVDEREHSDPTPIELPLGMSRPPTMAEMLQMYVRSELRNASLGVEHETFEEANDFDVDDDADPVSPYEMHDMHEDAFAKDLEAIRRERYEKAHPRKGKKVKQNVDNSPPPPPKDNPPKADAASGASGSGVEKPS